MLIREYAVTGPRSNKIKAMCATFFVAGVLVLPVTAIAFEINSATVGLTHDTNPARAQFTDDILSGQQVTLTLVSTLAANKADETGWGDFATLQLSASGAQIEDQGSDHSGLGENEVSLVFGAQHSGVELPGKPGVTVSSQVAYIDSETNLRDGITLGFGVSASYRPLSILDVIIGLRHDFRFADSEAFDTEKTQLFSSMEFGVGPRLSLQAGAQVVLGNEVSTATPTAAIVNQAQVIVPDGAFGGFNGRRFAYLLDANSALASLGVNYSISNDVFSNAQWTYIYTDAGGGIDYSRSLLSVALTYSFQ